MRSSLLGGWCLPLLMTAAVAYADIESGPPVGKPAPALSVQPVTNGQPGEAQNIVAERAALPTIYLFIPAAKLDRPLARFAKQLDTAVQKHQMLHPNLQMVIVWQVDDAAAGATRTSAIQGSLQLQATQWVIWKGDAAGPEGWAISDRASLTAVIVNNKDVQAKFGYDSVNETLVPAVNTALGKALAP